MAKNSQSHTALPVVATQWKRVEYCQNDCRNVRALGRVSYIETESKCPNGNLVKVAKFHTNPFNFLACLPNPYKLSILGDICRATILPFSSSKYFYSWQRL